MLYDDSNAKTLMELTRQESGIICYEGNTVGVWNWGSCEDYHIPMLSPIGGMISWPENESVFDGVSYRHVDDIREELPGRIWLDGPDDDGNYSIETDMDIVYDDHHDLARLFLGDRKDLADAMHWDPLDEYALEGTVYELSDGRKIIAPDMWN